MPSVSFIVYLDGFGEQVMLLIKNTKLIRQPTGEIINTMTIGRVITSSEISQPSPLTNFLKKGNKMINYNGCENEGHYIDPFLCCGQTKQELKARKGNSFIIIEYIPNCKKGTNNEPRVR